MECFRSWNSVSLGMYVGYYLLGTQLLPRNTIIKVTIISLFSSRILTLFLHPLPAAVACSRCNFNSFTRIPARRHLSSVTASKPLFSDRATQHQHRMYSNNRRRRRPPPLQLSPDWNEGPTQFVPGSAPPKMPRAFQDCSVPGFVPTSASFLSPTPTLGMRFGEFKKMGFCDPVTGLPRTPESTPISANGMRSAPPVLGSRARQVFFSPFGDVSPSLLSPAYAVRDFGVVQSPLAGVRRDPRVFSPNSGQLRTPSEEEQRRDTRIAWLNRARMLSRNVNRVLGKLAKEGEEEGSMEKEKHAWEVIKNNENFEKGIFPRGGWGLEAEIWC